MMEEAPKELVDFLKAMYNATEFTVSVSRPSFFNKDGLIFKSQEKEKKDSEESTRIQGAWSVSGSELVELENLSALWQEDSTPSSAELISFLNELNAIEGTLITHAQLAEKLPEVAAAEKEKDEKGFNFFSTNGSDFYKVSVAIPAKGAKAPFSVKSSTLGH
eukprot:TRINITY_DN903_c0_g2_i1.p1 TRINITY_DN903_c0_g2~~TRINITY_DN903_c0_g2_i1.p1  ORF type:complete len:162 (-),score=11.86 TRINITY_DN903_c0_g2_i1:49-534(-)